MSTTPTTDALEAAASDPTRDCDILPADIYALSRTLETALRSASMILCALRDSGEDLPDVGFTFDLSAVCAGIDAALAVPAAPVVHIESPSVGGHALCGVDAPRTAFEYIASGEPLQPVTCEPCKRIRARLEAAVSRRRCAHPAGCELLPADGDIYCEGCRSAIQRDHGDYDARD